jgi:hypothetical protein
MVKITVLYQPPLKGKEVITHNLFTMDKNTGYVRGQKVITPSGEGFISEASGDRITVKLDSGDTETFDEEDIEDNSDAG